MSLSDKEFIGVKDKIYEIAGISLSDAKRTLVVSRLTKLIIAAGLKSFDEYVSFLERGASAIDKQNFVNALTTNLTRFYREDHHFDHLVQYVGKMIATPNRAGGKPRLRIWSAGCSTGQEPYTIAMCLMQKFPQLKTWDFKILASDVDTNVVTTASKGVYSDNELSGLEAGRAKVFEKPGDGTIVIPAALRALITFKPLNLMEAWPVKGPFDAIFCRNVAIYFDKPTQLKMFGRFGDVLRDNAFMYIGHSENLGTGAKKFSLVGKTIYQRTPRNAERAVA